LYQHHFFRVKRQNVCLHFLCLARLRRLRVFSENESFRLLTIAQEFVKSKILKRLLGRLFAALEQQVVMEEPIVIISADHGEDMGHAVVSQCAHVAQRSVRFGDWIYIRTYHDVCMEAVYYLNEWHDEMMNRAGDDRDPLWTVMKEGGPFHTRGYLKGYVKRLEETGRGHYAEQLISGHPGEFPRAIHP